MESKLYHIKPGYLVEDIGEEYVLMAPAIGDIDYSKMLVLSESAAFIAEKLIDDSLGFDEMLSLLLAEYEADEKLVRDDLTKLLSTLAELNVLE